MHDFNELTKKHRFHNPDKEESEKIFNGINQAPFNANIGLVFTSHKGHMPYMRYALTQYRKIEDMYILGAYDPREVTPNSPNKNGFPYPDIWYLAHAWVTKHYTWGGLYKRHGWLWLHLYASAILKQFDNLKHIFSANGDCVWDKPEGVYTLIDEILGDNDFMSGQSQTRETDGFNFIHTCSLVFKRDAYFDFIDFIKYHVKISDTASFSPENLIQMWVKSNNIKWEHAPEQPIYPNGEYKGQHDIYAETGTPSTWSKILGYKNIEAEKNWRCSNGINPFDKRYFDLRDITHNKALYYSDHDKNTLCQYYLTGDYRYVKMWWDQDPVTIPKAERIERMKKTLEDYN